MPRIRTIRGSELVGTHFRLGALCQAMSCEVRHGGKRRIWPKSEVAERAPTLCHKSLGDVRLTGGGSVWRVTGRCQPAASLDACCGEVVHWFLRVFHFHALIGQGIHSGAVVPRWIGEAGRSLCRADVWFPVVANTWLEMPLAIDPADCSGAGSLLSRQGQDSLCSWEVGGESSRVNCCSGIQAFLDVPDSS